MITRFAPSPTGPLHLGHAYSAMLGFDMAKAVGGTFHVRIDDIDQSRARPEYEVQLLEDLRWLGLSWPEPPRKQSQHRTDYRAAFDQLTQLGLLYPCQCSRKDILAAANAPQEGDPAFGPDGVVYPGTCRSRPMSATTDQALRLNMNAALNLCSEIPTFTETGPFKSGLHPLDFKTMLEGVGDVVLQRRDGSAAYHLAVVVDDAAQGITDVVRGMDLFEATQIHVLLAALLELPIPAYHHHRLIRDPHGKRLAKRDDARAIAKFRADGARPADIRTMVGL